MSVSGAASLGPVLPRDHPLAGCEAKYWRGHEHFDILNKDIRNEYRTGKVKFVTFRGELHPDTENVFRYVVGHVDAPALRYATIIGDIIHNIRSILDHLVFELAFLGTNGKVIPGRVAYPCSRTRKNWLSKYVQNTLLAGVMQKHRAMIYRTQPCYRRQDAVTDAALRRRKASALVDLDNLWNHDKHRMLQPPFVVPVTMQGTVVKADRCEITGQPRVIREFFARPLQPNTELFAIPIRPTGIDPYVHVQFTGTADIWFSNGLPVLETIAAIADRVKAIVEWFEPEFETPKARRLWGLSRQGWLETAPVRGRVNVWVTGDDPAKKPPGVP